MVKTLRGLACKFDLDQSECKSTQVHARPGQTESQVDRVFNLRRLLARPFGQVSMLLLMMFCFTICSRDLVHVARVATSRL